MGSPVALRGDFDAAVLRLLARRTLDADRGRRLLALAAVHDGGSQADAAGARIEIWFDDEARVGRKNKITRRWARRGARPRAPHDQRTRSAYISGAICPQEGKGAGLVPPFCNGAAMTLHPEEISGAVAPDAHAVLVMDRAGWHTSATPGVPANITVVPLPPRSPELDPVENVWRFMRDNWLSNRVFKSHDDIVEHRCDACNRLVARPWKIIPIGHRQWPHRR